MTKDAYWFPHDSNAHTDPKMVKLLRLSGWAGHGVYWMMVGLLRSENEAGYKLPLDYIDDLCFSMRIERKIIDAVFESQLLQDDGEMFWSESLIRRMAEWDEKRKRRVDAGRKGGQAKARAKHKQCSSNAKAMVKQCSSKKRTEQERTEHRGAPAPDVDLISTNSAELVRLLLESWPWSQESAEALVMKLRSQFSGESHQTLMAIIREAKNTWPVDRDIHDSGGPTPWIIRQGKMYLRDKKTDRERSERSQGIAPKKVRTGIQELEKLIRENGTVKLSQVVQWVNEVRPSSNRLHGSVDAWLSSGVLAGALRWEESGFLRLRGEDREESANMIFSGDTPTPEEIAKITGHFGKGKENG